MKPEAVVQDCAAQRQATPRPMTIAQAFEEAQWLRRMPEGILSPTVARQTIECLYAAIDAHPSLRKALERNQEIFVLVAQDSELIRVHRRDMNVEGIRMLVKGGRWETLLWSPGMRKIVAAAEALPTASRFPASPLFPHSRGKAYSYSGWHAAWVALLDEANAALAAGVVDPETLELLPGGLAIDDLHVHDVRSKVHDDAEEQGREGHAQLGNTEGVADRHYARRERRRRPLR